MWWFNRRIWTQNFGIHSGNAYLIIFVDYLSINKEKQSRTYERILLIKSRKFGDNEKTRTQTQPARITFCFQTWRNYLMVKNCQQWRGGNWGYWLFWGVQRFHYKEGIKLTGQYEEIKIFFLNFSVSLLERVILGLSRNITIEQCWRFSCFTFFFVQCYLLVGVKLSFFSNNY